MAEPRIGMKFSSYLEMGKEYEKKSSSAKISSYERNTNNNPFDKTTVFDTIYLDKNGTSLAHSSLETNGNEQNSTFSTDSFKYTGTGHTYDKDIKYTKIYGIY